MQAVTINGYSQLNYAGAKWFLDHFGMLESFDTPFQENINRSWFMFGNSTECHPDSSFSCLGFVKTVGKALDTLYGRDATTGDRIAVIAGALNIGQFEQGAGLEVLTSTNLNQRISINNQDNETGSLLVRSASTPPLPSVPIPAAVWLFGAGLIGLMGVSRNKKS